jgi:hypothetical protein
MTMPEAPRRRDRNAVKVMRIGTEEEETVIDDGKDPAAKALGAKGGESAPRT